MRRAHSNRLRQHRSTKNTAFHANLDQLDAWLPMRDDASPKNHHLIKEIRAMLSHDPGQRPVAHKLLHRLVLCDKMSDDKQYSIFGHCCRTMFVLKKDHEEQVELAKEENGRMANVIAQHNLQESKLKALSDTLQWDLGKTQSRLLEREEHFVNLYREQVHQLNEWEVGSLQYSWAFTWY